MDPTPLDDSSSGVVEGSWTPTLILLSLLVLRWIYLSQSNTAISLRRWLQMKVWKAKENTKVIIYIYVLWKHSWTIYHWLFSLYIFCTNRNYNWRSNLDLEMKVNIRWVLEMVLTWSIKDRVKNNEVARSKLLTYTYEEIDSFYFHLRHNAKLFITYNLHFDLGVPQS